jgi:hypothetical protein
MGHAQVLYELLTVPNKVKKPEAFKTSLAKPSKFTVHTVCTLHQLGVFAPLNAFSNIFLTMYFTWAAETSTLVNDLNKSWT